MVKEEDVIMINWLLNNIMVILFIAAILLSFLGFTLTKKVEKDEDFIKRINKRFRLKYIIWFMLIIGILFLVVSFILFLIFAKIGIYFIFGSYLFLIVSVIWAFAFDKIDIYFDYSKNMIVEKYISFFAENEISNIKYSEVIAWFSRWNNKYYKSKIDEEQDVDKLIARLELILRPYDNGLCLASYHKKDFLKLCAEWKDSTLKDKLDNIYSISKEMESKTPEKYRVFTLSLDHNILIYLSVIALHIMASILISDGNVRNTIANILFYIPSDILLILVYKGFIREKE